MENKNQLIQYQLINPSDPYTFLAPDLETAALTVFCLGTMYGAEPQGKGENVPVFYLVEQKNGMKRNLTEDQKKE